MDILVSDLHENTAGFGEQIASGHKSVSQIM